MNKVLIILPKRLGDTLFCTPAIHFLYKHNPHLEIGAIACSSLCAELLKNNPAIKQIFLADNVDIGKIKANYEQVLKIHEDKDVEAWINKLLLPVVNLPLAREPNQHIAEYYLRALSRLLNQPILPEDKTYFIFPSTADEKAVDTLMAEYQFNEHRRLIGLHLGCHSIAKRKWSLWPFPSLSHEKVWPIKQFIQLAKRLNDQNAKIQFILTGSNTESILAERFARKISNSINLVGKTSVHQLKLLCDKLDVYISSDTGPLHLACASQCQVIALVQKKLQYFGTGPFPINDKNHLLTADDLNDLSVETVLQEITNLNLG